MSDGSITVNGTARFTKDYGNPTRWKLYTKRLERGKWVPGIVSRDIPNVCPVLQMPHELWYPFTRLMRRKFCPFKAGATLTLEFDEDFRDCDNGLPMPGFDASELQVIPQDDGSVTMNGTIKFTKDYASPTRMKLHSKRLQQGEWKPGMFSREIRDLCPVMQMPTELWYPFTRILQQKTCPYRAGVS
ncbi:hypothetical protein pipiens_003613 [Culex pipiens pipiens]|uniref:Uncharacterized protein n=1 Tax=Culex pipiens pipiens TaxID=38569 RepID=A0ABD1CUV6_CULPP